MKKTMRKVAITAVSFLFTLSVGALLAENKNVFIASAETVAVEENFTMQDGAYIRIMSDTPSGIRWSVNVSKAYYEYVQSAAAGSSFEFGTYVDETPIEVSEGNVVSTTAIKIPCTTSQTPEFDEETGVWTYSASILYSELAQEIHNKLVENNVTDETIIEEKVENALQAAYETVLYARGYAKIGSAYEYAVEADTGRSVRGVAMNYLIENTSDVTDSNKTDFEAYAGGDYTVEKTEAAYDIGITNAYSELDGMGTVTSEETLAAGDYQVYVGAKRMDDVTLDSDGVATATVADLGKSLYEAGKDYNVRFVNAETKKVHQVPFRYATKVIDEFSDFSVLKITVPSAADGGQVKVQIKGYYLLTKTLTSAGTTYEFTHSGVTSTRVESDEPNGFMGTFDGNGFALKNLYWPWGGVFGIVNGATIKNLSIEMTSKSDTFGDGKSPGYILAKVLNNATISNCHISGVISKTGIEIGGLACYMNQYTKIENSIIDIQITSSSYTSAAAFMTPGYYVTNWATYANANNTLNNVYVYTNKPLNYRGTVSRFYGENEAFVGGYTEETALNGVYVYANAAAYQTADASDKGKATSVEEWKAKGFNENLWVLSADSAPVWRDAPVKA